MLGDIVEFLTDALSGVLNAVKNLIWNVLYLIWMLIAWIVDAIEVVFRKLAGLNVDGEDLVTRIIKNPAVETIFGNLIGFATAMMIFFTIVKILQDHYKEKDGGNPYKIVLRTFKGMLMFAFVGVAVGVGLYATGVVFRGLDAATSGGSASIGGQIFKAMAAEANRKEKGQLTDGGIKSVTNYAYNKHWNRVAADGGLDYGKYVLVEVKDNATQGTKAELRERYLQLCPEYQYGIVNTDGSVTSIAPYLQSLMADLNDASVKDEMKDTFENWYGHQDGEGWNENNKWTDNGDGQISGFGGYKNDILSAVSINITPSIDLTWSPIDIKTYTYEIMQDGAPITWDINIVVFGSGINISFMIEKVKFWKTAETEKSLEETSKQFGISMKGSAGLQDGELSASFSLEMFDPEIFGDLLASVIVNVVYANLMQILVEAIPSMYAVYSVSGISVNSIQLFSPLILELMEELINETFGELIPVAKERNADGELVPIKKNGEEVKMVTPFRYATSEEAGSNRGVWMDINNKAPSMPITIEKYIIDGNFEELWSQLTDNWNELVEDLNTATKETYKKYDETAAAIDEQNRKFQDQSEWRSYKEVVNKYNTYALNQLNNLGNLLSAYEVVKNLDDGTPSNKEEANQILAGEKKVSEGSLTEARELYSGNLDDLKEEIKEVFVNLVSYYNSTAGSSANKRPSSTYADAKVTQSIYKPILELKFSNDGAAADSIDAAYIYDLFMNNGGSNRRKIDYNLYVESVGNGYAASRHIDWSAYGLNFSTFNNEVADLYYTSEVGDSDGIQTNKATLKQNQTQMRIINVKDPSSYDMQTHAGDVGIKYFFLTSNDKSVIQNLTHKRTNKDGYWGNRGVTIGGYRYYEAYENHTIVPNTDNCWGENGNSGYSTETTVSNSSIYTSSAQSNAALEESKLETHKQIAALADVSEEKSELATKFSKNIIRFRKLNTAADGEPTLEEEQEKDKAVLKGWVDAQSVAAAPADSDAYSVAEMSASEIDTLMATGPGKRRYLMLTRDGLSTADAKGNYASFIGMFSYKNIRTVNALYDVGDINYIIGYIAMVSALGVYLNFAFGLIKRAVNMAVLYIMSPISIAFYPFDDGSKFNQQFVSPFYKEAISAFAVIVSLNIFVLLLSPVQTAVEGVLGGGVAGWIGGWLALVAFTSMLPSIRDTITSVLGASKMESKGLGQMIDDATGAMGNAFSGLKSKSVTNAAKGLASKIDHHRKTKAAMEAQKQVKDLKEKSKLEQLNKDGKLSWLGKKRLDRLNGNIEAKKKRDEKEKKLQDALSTGNTDGLSMGQKMRYKALNHAAEKKLNADAKNGVQYQGMAGREAAKQKLLQDKSWQKTVGGVAKLKKAGATVNAAGKSVGRALNTANNWVKNLAPVKAASNFVGDVGRGAKRRLFGEGTYLGEAFKAKMDKKKGDSNSLLGSFMRFKDPALFQEDMKKYAEAELKKEEKKSEPNKAAMTAFSRLVSTSNNANTKRRNRAEKIAQQKAKKEVAEKMVNDAVNDDKAAFDMLESVYMEKYKKQNPKISNDLARKKARADIVDMFDDGHGNMDNSKLRDELLKTNYVEHCINKLVNGEKIGNKLDLSSEAAKAQIGSIASNMDLAAIEHEIQELGKGGSKAIKLKLDTEIAESEGSIKSFTAAMSEVLKFDSEDDKKKMTEIIEKSRDDGTFGTKEMIDEMVAAFGGQTVNGIKIDNDTIANIMAANPTTVEQLRTSSEKIADLQTAHEAAVLDEKAVELMMSKLGPYVSQENVKQMADAFKNLHDTNIYSSNPDSMGAKLRVIDQDPDLTSEQKIKMKAELQTQMTNSVTAQFQQFMQEENANIRKFSASKNFKEDLFKTESISMITAAQDQMEFEWTMTATPVKQIIVNDTLFQNAMTDGDPVQNSIIMQETVQAVKMGDYQKARSLGMDQETINSFINWAEAGNTEYLDQVSKIAQSNAAFLGCLDETMGGDSIAGARSALTNVSQVAWSKRFEEVINTRISMAGSDETRANAAITDGLSKLKNMLSGQNWQSIYESGSLVTPDGKTIRNRAEMEEALKKITTSIQSGKESADSYALTMFKDVLTKARDQHPDDYAFVQEMNEVTSLFSNATTSYDSAQIQHKGYKLKAEMNAKYDEKYKKMN